jgi:hypothetical protein
VLTPDLCRDVFGVERHDARHDERPILVFSSVTTKPARKEATA